MREKEECFLKLRDLLRPKGRGCTVQTGPGRLVHPFEGWMGYAPLRPPEAGLYDAIRVAVPVVDAALEKIVRLTGGFRVECTDKRHQVELERFLRDVRVGPSSQGIRQFAGVYLDSLLTYGNAVGEVVLDSGGTEIFALYNARLSDVRVRQGKSPLEVVFCASGDGLAFTPVKYPELILFTPLSPPAGELLGVSLLRSLPFVTGILMKIWGSTGTNFERIANLRYAVTYRPGAGALDKAYAQEIAAGIADQWGDAMSAAKNGVIKDFVAVGDVDIKVIGADNQMLDTQVPVRQMLEQIVAKLGIPPFMLGLHWSSTERMSAQQADILTSELESYRVLLDGVIRRICDLFLRLHGWGCGSRVVWDDINLQDEVETANARLLNAQAKKLEREMEGEAYD